MVITCLTCPEPDKGRLQQIAYEAHSIMPDVHTIYIFEALCLVHCNFTPLDLQAMHDTDDDSLEIDISMIMRTVDKETGVTIGYVSRFARS